MREAGVRGAVAWSLRLVFLTLQGAGPNPPALLTLRGPAFMAVWPPLGVGLSPWQQVFLVVLTSVTCGAAGCEGGGLRSNCTRQKVKGRRVRFEQTETRTRKRNRASKSRQQRGSR